MECAVCSKHQNPAPLCGELLAEKSGWILSHFPVVNGEPAPKGHLLLETKRHVTDLLELNETELAALGPFLKSAAKALKLAIEAPHVYVFRLNEITPHLHFHIVSRFADTPAEQRGAKYFDWPGRPKVTLEEIKVLNTKIKLLGIWD